MQKARHAGTTGSFTRIMKLVDVTHFNIRLSTVCWLLVPKHESPESMSIVLGTAVILGRGCAYSRQRDRKTSPKVHIEAEQY